MTANSSTDSKIKAVAVDTAAPSTTPVSNSRTSAWLGGTAQPRAAPVETTIWRVEVMIIALKQETDGDYHLVLQGASGETMIGEIPTPRPPFVATSSPWLANIKAARAAVDEKLLKHLSPAAFVAVQGKLIPRESLTIQPEATRGPISSSSASARPAANGPKLCRSAAIAERL